MKAKTVVIYGGKFNPIHDGHLQIITKLHQYFKNNDIWVVPSYIKNLSKNHRKLITELLLEQCIFYFNEHVKVMQYELENKINCTLDSIAFLKKAFPKYHFIFIIGADNVVSFHNWEGANELANFFKKIYFFTRDVMTQKFSNQDFQQKIINQQTYGIKKLGTIVSPLESSQIRKGYQINLLNQHIAYFITYHLLYIKNWINESISVPRQKHIFAVVKYATMLAYIHIPTHVHEIQIAAYFHDFTKEWSLEKQNFWLKKVHMSLNIPNAIKHQYTAPIYLRYYFQFNHNIICKAISFHTSPSCYAMVMDKVLFLADKLCDGRELEDFWNIKLITKLRNISKQNLDKAFILLLIFFSKNTSGVEQKKWLSLVQFYEKQNY